MNLSRFRNIGRAAAALVLALTLGACAQTSVVDSWVAEGATVRKPQKVAVIVALPDALMRQAVEIDMAEIIRKGGTPAVAGSNLPGLNGGIRGKIDTEKVGKILERDGVDGVIVSFYTGGERSGEYVRSGYYTEYEGTGMGWGWAEPYFVDVYTVRHGEDPADFQIRTWVETSYHDLKTEQTIWRIVTETKDIEHTDTAADVAHAAASKMSATGLN